MSLALELRVDDGAQRPLRRLAQAVTGLGAAAAALAGFELLAREVPWPFIAGGLLLAGTVLGRGTPRASPQGNLRVTPAGRIVWEAGGADAAAACARAERPAVMASLELQRWQFAARFAWLELRAPDGSGELRLTLARDSFSAEQWSALGRWLTWSGRTGARRPT